MATTALATSTTGDSSGNSINWGFPAAVAAAAAAALAAVTAKESAEEPQVGLNAAMTQSKVSDGEMALAQLKGLRRKLQEAVDGELFFDAVEEMGVEEWMAFPRPPELLFLSGNEPEEIQMDVQCEQQKYYLTPEVPEPEISSGAPTSPTVSVYSSSGDSSGDNITAATGSSGIRSIRSKLSSIHVRRAAVASSISSTSGDSASLASTNITSGGTVVRKQRTFDHSGATTEDLAYSAYFSLLPKSARPEILKPVSPRGEAIKNYLKSRKEQSECVSCLEDHRVKTLTTLPCQHKYCSTCLRTLITTALNDEALFPPKCCLNEIPAATINSVLTRAERSLYKNKAPEYEVPWEQRHFCPRPSCGAWIPPALIESIGTAYVFRCKKCHHRLCRYCKGPMHPAGTECPEDAGLVAVMDVAQRCGWRRCYKCHAMVELSSGCRHMRCRCKAEFCYICGARWRTCECTGTEPVYTRPVVTMDPAAVEERRLILSAIEAADSADAAELRPIHGIEEPEVDSSDEAERRRVEAAQERFIPQADAQVRGLRVTAEMHEARRANKRTSEIAQVRKEREAAKRRKEIDAALQETKERYDGLIGAVKVLCAEQRAKIEDRHQDLKDSLTTRWKVEMDNMISFLDIKILEMEGALAASIETMQTRHEEETSSMQDRHEKEEDDYWFSLQRYLKGKPDRAEREQVLVDRFRAANVLELEELLSRHSQEANAARRRLAADAVETLRQAERRKAELERDVGKSQRMRVAKIWVAEMNWVALAEKERTSLLAARMGEEQDAVRVRMAAS